jgi:hypothetical protein
MRLGTFEANKVVVEAIVGVRRGSRHPYHWTAECEYLGVAAPPEMEGCGGGAVVTRATRSEAILECLAETLEMVEEVGARLVDDLQTFEPGVTFVVHVNDVTPREALVTDAERQLLGPEPVRAEQAEGGK